MPPVILYKGRLDNLRPIIWSGEPVYYRYHALRRVLEARLGAAYADLLSEPLISRDALDGNEDATWISPSLTEKQTLNDLPEAGQAAVIGRLAAIRRDMVHLSRELKDSQSVEERRVGDLLLQALRVPGRRHVFVEGDRIVFACWGFAPDRRPGPGDVDIWEEALSKLTLELVDHQGRIAPDHEVIIRCPGQQRRLTTAADGRASAGGLPRLAELTLEIPLPGGRVHQETVVLDQKEVFHSPRLPAPPKKKPGPPPAPKAERQPDETARLTVEVVNADGTPAPAATVSLDMAGRRETETADAGGRAVFADLPPNTPGRLLAEGPHGAAPLEVVCREAEQFVRIELGPAQAPAATLTFRVEDPQGRAVTGLLLTLSDEGRPRQAETDPEGRAVFEGLELGRAYDLTIEGLKAPFQETYTCGERENEYVIVVEKRGFPWPWLILGAVLLLLIALLIWYFWPRPAPGPPFPRPGLRALPPDQTAAAPQDPWNAQIAADRLAAALNDGADVSAFIEAFHKEHGSSGARVIGYQEGLGLVQIQAPPGQREALAERLETRPEVFRTLREAVLRGQKRPADPGFKDPAQQWWLERIGAYEAWDSVRGDPGVVVAVIDAGFDADHPELADRVTGVYNVFEGAPHLTGSTAGQSHGTHLAAVVAGAAGNGEGVAGVCPECSLMLIQAGDDSGRMTNLSVMTAYQYALDHGARVILLPLGPASKPSADFAALDDAAQAAALERHLLGTEGEAALWERLFQKGKAAGAVVVQAAGNQDAPAVADPMKRSDATIIVAAVDQGDRKAAFSNFGDAAVISAPGTKVYSALPGSAYGYQDGTSAAAGMVAGAAGLLLSQHPDLTASRVRGRLVASADPVGYPPEKPIGPRLNLAVAVKKLTLPPQGPLPPGETRPLEETPAGRLEPPQGAYESTDDLYSRKTGERVRLHFHFEPGGGGRVVFVESGGDECAAPISASIKGEALIIDQLEKAPCSGRRAYAPYGFECRPGEGDAARCVMQNKEDRQNILEFDLWVAPEKR